jgi:hypothetical protein
MYTLYEIDKTTQSIYFLTLFYESKKILIQLTEIIWTAKLKLYRYWPEYYAIKKTKESEPFLLVVRSSDASVKG